MLYKRNFMNNHGILEKKNNKKNTEVENNCFIHANFNPQQCEKLISYLFVSIKEFSFSEYWFFKVLNKGVFPGS